MAGVSLRQWSTGDRTRVRSHQLFHSLIAASLIACSDCLGSLSVGLLWKQWSSCPYVLEADAGGHCDWAVGEIRGGGLFNPQFKPFRAQDICSCCMFENRNLLYSVTPILILPCTQTTIFDISLVRAAELLHISLWKCTCGWTRFRWCHWVKKGRRADHEVRGTSNERRPIRMRGGGLQGGRRAYGDGCIEDVGVVFLYSYHDSGRPQL